MKKYFDPALRIKRFDREAILTASGTDKETNMKEAEAFLKTRVTDPDTIDILTL